MAGIDRRTFLAGAAAAIAAPGAARAFGIPAGPDLDAAFRAARGVEEGAGRGVLHILFAPWCHVSPAMHRDSRSVLGRLRLRWIPYSGGQPEGSEAAERLLASGDPADLPGTFVRVGRLADAARAPTPLCDEQDAYVARTLEPLVVRDGGRALSTPTLAYVMGAGRVRLVPGGIVAGQFGEIAELAAG